MTTAPKVIYLKDYQQTPYTIKHVDLRFDLREDFTDVKSILSFEARNSKKSDLVLDGKELELQKLILDGRELTAQEYRVEGNRLTVFAPPASFTLEVHNRIRPHLNTWLEGLYVSKGIFSTQCEAEGFRRITYFYDRPDVMSTYRVTINADKISCPVLLSNGNRVASGELPDNRHFVTWEDPFPKPCYLFALVAGKLGALQDTFKTRSGKTVNLAIYADEKDVEKCHHGMHSLKQAMKWDEEAYGLECDLDNFNIVAVRDFNMGAMENKGLNIFNSARVLASKQTTTDGAFQDIAAVIGHEYFHNWTGNRVTCRDWFQLCLKEGLTVFRDQEFSQAIYSKAVQRIDQVLDLRQRQFTEDDGPTAHPPRPDHFVEINNFYTATVYQKGAEIVRMLKTLIGAENFRKGMDLYFQRHDGQAVTQEDFVQAMADASGKDLTQFMLWYTQAGAPHIEVHEDFDAAKHTYALTLTQKKTAPMHIPVRMGLLDGDGKVLLEERVLELTKERETFVFSDIKSKPVPSLFRNFSAPVRFATDLPKESLMLLMKHDSDPVNAWDAGQKILTRQLVNLALALQKGADARVEVDLKDAFGFFLNKKIDDAAFLALMIGVPSSESVAQKMDVIDPEAIHQARVLLKREIASAHRDVLHRLYQEHHRVDAFGSRKLKNTCLHYLSSLRESSVLELVVTQYHGADNMTDRFAALCEMTNWEANQRPKMLEHFYREWKHEDLVIDYWFSAQALSTLPGSFADVQRLVRHPDFNARNPNRLRSLVGAFCMNNPFMFHQSSGEGYRFCGEQVIAVDGFNRQVAARLVRAFGQWRRFDGKRQALMRAELERIQAHPGISPDVFELVGQMLSPSL